MKKILFLYHMEERELLQIKYICKEIQKIDSTAQVEYRQFTGGCEYALQFMPDIIVTIPPRTELNSDLLTNVKLITNAVIVSATTEGLDDYSSEFSLNSRLGFNTYSINLVDYYIYWGEKASRIFSERLLQSEKVTSIDRIKTFGYILYDKQALANDENLQSLKKNICEWTRKFERTITFVTGFDKDEITVDDRIEEGSVSSINATEEEREHEIELIKEAIAKNKYYCNQYLHAIEYLAEKYPTIGFCIKLHPNELLAMKEGNCARYEKFRNSSNVLVVDYPVSISAILSESSMLVHYGSTTAMEAYLYKVPSIQVTSERGREKVFCYGRVMFESTAYVSVDQVEEIESFIQNRLEFKRIPSIDQMLKESFNFDIEQPYNPATWFAEFYTSELKLQKLDKSDAEVKKALDSGWGFMMRKRIYVKMIKSFVRLKLKDYYTWKRKVKLILPEDRTIMQDFIEEFKIKLAKHRKGENNDSKI